ncbi:U11/U12 small nuclear ribonucleoprotein 25 kDa protein-like [Macadamia integrifolia]|uniref:U11/U12 small nuclear ribonucleoprotein 25 kDa protein-like n=1 Tax=Macadamia integrifolia TaxID=60698 RepID=UPI001C4E90C3|nr:U11/U12 small nuclear ribonucleoprotein 25 kDa protein-like [Macadamia integrifolia]
MPRSIVQIGSPSPRCSFDGFGGDFPTFSPLCSDVVSRRSYYHKLPQLLYKLSILKLDGSSFDVQVARTSSVAEVKEAIEDFFHLSPKDGQDEISWSHVWGHFCLSFEGQKLVNDKAYIRSFGIKDGDQVCLDLFYYSHCLV